MASADSGSGACTVEVALRVRPMAPHESADGCEKAVVTLDDATVMVGADKQFTYNYAFGESCTQADVFDACVRPLVLKCLDGYNATIFAYGQTVRGAGARRVGTGMARPARARAAVVGADSPQECHTPDCGNLSSRERRRRIP